MADRPVVVDRKVRIDLAQALVVAGIRLQEERDGAAGERAVPGAKRG